MKTIAILLALTSGCAVLPKTKTTTKDLGTETGPIEHGAVNKIALKAELNDATIEVAATADRECFRMVYRVVETTKEKHASYRANKDARLGLFALALAPLTIPISAVVTGVSVLADGDGSSTRAHTNIGTEKFACTTVAAGTTIALRMPSGAEFSDITDEEGMSRMRIPETEPYTGVIALSTGATHAELRYTRAMPAITAVRETVMTCSALHRVSGKLNVELGIDDDGRPVRIGVDAGDGLFAKCMNEGLANTRFGKTHRGAKLVLPFELPG
jgi:hypothetical protein